MQTVEPLRVVVVPGKHTIGEADVKVDVQVRERAEALGMRFAVSIDMPTSSLLAPAETVSFRVSVHDSLFAAPER